ncbi:MAG: SUMF1/EgtB/PvdO family nonheme iron enzyme [Treponema sp.]|jgi:hypothetical protein|nr:SUMF1/EgtB/PvdO family nonheme iron enzyme [Treponema sp.]
MFWKKEKLEIKPEDEVRLQPIFGVQPEVYLACLYGAVIAAALFFILFYPGISNPGTVLVAESEPEGAAVFVDDVYQAATPAQIFVPKGEHTVSVSLPGFSPREQVIDVEGRLFGSLFFPKKRVIRETLTSADPKKALAMGAADFAAWSFAGEPTSAYQTPQPLSEAAYRVAPLLTSADGLLEAAARFASNRSSLRDLIRAKRLVDNAGIAASPLSLLASTQNALAYLNKNPAAFSVLSQLIPKAEWDKIADSAWVKRSAAEKEPPVLSEKKESVLIRGLSCVEISSGNDTFFLSETIPDWSWELFLQTTPEWSAENPAEGVSWFAAQAYCKWFAAQTETDGLEKKLYLPQLESARLPFKDELETAARAGFAFDGQKYEWCEDFFAPIDFLSADAESISAVGSPERAVFSRDGEKASLPPALSSPFVSFRMVIK